ncbi:MAG: sigma-54-dependent Fis family transcriptional regulator [Desulfobacterales bacterium]|nr:sigma-54-dependent Fis family transcriptional regulator [Desulfobacterales bacterium]
MASNRIRIAVIDDEKVSGLRLQEALADQGYPTDFFADGESFLEIFDHAPHDLVVTDMKLPGVNGLEILRRVKARQPKTEVVVITGYASIDSAIEATRAGAFHYLTKPIRLAEFENLVARAIEKIELCHEAADLRALMMRGAGREGMIGTSPEMVELYRLIEKVAPLDCPVIIQGESGTGKELVARAIHRLSLRREAPIVSFNCGGFSQELIANELFGHEKGAFTGAFSSKVGLLETANHGTVLLDEIAEMPSDMQVKLLRVLQEGQIYRVGGNRSVNLDIRILAATNRDLETAVTDGKFREDLFFRLNVMTVALPRLRDREGDIWLLAEHFLQKISLDFHKRIKGFSAAARTALAGYDYPGNVRELENIVARAVALAEGDEIQVPDLPPFLAKRREGQPLLGSLESLEKDHIARVLAAFRGHRDQAAAVLGITRSTLWRKMKKFGLKA